MSRIGKKPIDLPAGTDISFQSGTITVKGPKGSLSYNPPKEIDVEKEENKIICKRSTDLRQVRAYHGLVRSLLNNMVTGVSKGFTKSMEIIGVGYRAKIEGNALVMSLGFSHPVVYPIPQGISINVQGNTIEVSGIDKQQVGAVAAKIRGYYPPEPYKGKGIRYVGEKVRRKAGKTVSKK